MAKSGKTTKKANPAAKRKDVSAGPQPGGKA